MFIDLKPFNHIFSEILLKTLYLLIYNASDTTWIVIQTPCNYLHTQGLLTLLPFAVCKARESLEETEGNKGEEKLFISLFSRILRFKLGLYHTGCPENW